MRIKKAAVVLLAFGFSLAFMPASRASDDPIKDKNGNSFMEEEKAPPAQNDNSSQNFDTHGTPPEYEQGMLNDRNGNAFMEEVTPQNRQPRKQVRLPQDYSNVGVPTDQRGHIIPRIMPNAPAVVEAGNSGIQAYNEIPALTGPNIINGVPIGGYGTSYVPTGPMMSVPNPYYQQPNMGIRIGPLNLRTGAPYYPYGYAPPANVMVPVAPNSTTTFSSPFGSSTVTNTTRTFGPSATPPFPIPDQ